MGLTSLVNAPSLMKPASPGDSLPPLGRFRPRREDSSINALFEDGLIGIDEESPLEEPLDKTLTIASDDTPTGGQASNISVAPVNSIWSKQKDGLSSRITKGRKNENQNSTKLDGVVVPAAAEGLLLTTTQGGKANQATNELETPPNEENFKRKWKESLPEHGSQRWEKKNALDNLLTTFIPEREAFSKNEKGKDSEDKKDDEWGETTDIFLMLPDGSEGGGKMNADQTERRFAMQKKPPFERTETTFEFGEYQPSCLSEGRRTPVAGRRRSSPTNFTAKVGPVTEKENDIRCDLSLDASKQLDVARKDGHPNVIMSRGYFPSVDQEAKPVSSQQHHRGRARLQQRPLTGILEGSKPQAHCLDNTRAEDNGSDKDMLIDKDNSENSLFERLRQTLVANGIIESERNQLGNDVKHLKEENGSLKEEILKIEKEKLEMEKEMSEMELSRDSTLCKQFLEAKEEAQRSAIQLSSEIQLLKNSCILADEKLSSLQKVYQQEVDMLKDSHARELEGKEKQMKSERAFLENQKHTTETLTELVSKSTGWCKKVEEVQHSMVVEREYANKSRSDWLDALERSFNEQHSFMSEWCRKSDSMQKQFEEIMLMLSLGVKDIKDLQTTERDYLLKERANLQALQETLQVERVQSLADLTDTRQKLDEIRNMCLQEKETFLQKCFEERKELAAERDAILRMREQVYHADAALEKQLLEHAARIQSETGEMSKQRSELERARVMAAEIAQEVESGRRELEFRYQAFERERRLKDSTAESDCKQKLKSRSRSSRKRGIYRSSDFSQSSTTPLFRLIQHNPWNQTIHQLRKKVKRRNVAELNIGSTSLGKNRSEELMGDTEAFRHLQDQRQFLQEAKRNLHLTTQFVKSLSVQSPETWATHF